MRFWLGVGVLVAVAATAGSADVAAAAARPASGFFRTPSNNIHCFYGSDRAAPILRGVVCGIKSGLKPPPPTRGPNCFVTNRVSLSATGRARFGRSICRGEPEGDAGPFAGEGVAWVLGYGTTWNGGSVRCTSTMAGLTCRNRSGHGFFLSRERSRMF